MLTEVTAPTGELSLAVLSHGSVAHRKVSDTADARLEDQLNRFMVMLVRAAIAFGRNAFNGRCECGMSVVRSGSVPWLNGSGKSTDGVCASLTRP